MSRLARLTADRGRFVCRCSAAFTGLVGGVAYFVPPVVKAITASGSPSGIAVVLNVLFYFGDQSLAYHAAALFLPSFVATAGGFRLARRWEVADEWRTWLGLAPLVGVLGAITVGTLGFVGVVGVLDGPWPAFFALGWASLIIPLVGVAALAGAGPGVGCGYLLARLLVPEC